MQVVFGHEVLDDNDLYLEIAKDGGSALTNCGPIGNTPVDLFPLREWAAYLFCQHLLNKMISRAPAFVVPRYTFRLQGEGVESLRQEIT